MTKGSIFENNCTQAVRLPLATRFPKSIKKVIVRKVGKERILTPFENMWDSFFLSNNSLDKDFLRTRASQKQKERESLDD